MYVLKYTVKQGNPTQQIIKELSQWHHNLDPSLGLLKSMLTQYFSQDNFKSFGDFLSKIDRWLLQLQQYKCPKIFVRAILALVKSNPHLREQINIENVANRWEDILPEIVEYYFEAFGIGVDLVHEKENKLLFKISAEKFQDRIRKLIDRRDYDGAIILIKYIRYPENIVRLLLQKMANNRDAAKAANFIKTHKINPKLVPEVGERLSKTMVRYFLKSNGWEGVEEIFDFNNEALAMLVEDLVFRKDFKPALSVWWRHQGIEKYLGKEDTKTWLQEVKAKGKQEIQKEVIENGLFQDYFGPSNKEVYLQLKQFGIGQEDVIWVGQKGETMQRLISSMAQADLLAIDTESIVGKTKLQRNKVESASIVQIAFANCVYILDGNIKSNPQLRASLLKYIESGRPVIGHALTNDLDGFLLAFGLGQSQLSMVKFKNIIDTCSLFKAVYEGEKYSNLAYICKKVLGKEVCKKQTMSNWARRPLRMNQLHYAAMDAFCCIRIYEELRKQVGEHMINYFLGRDFE